MKLLVLDKKWKWALAGILLLGAIVLLFGFYTYFFWTCCALPPKPAPITSNESGDTSILKDPNLIYAERAFVGFCRTKSEYGGSCRFNTYLYSSGKLIMESNELVMTPDGEKTIIYPTTQKELDKNLMDRIIKQIQDSGIMDKSCEAEMVTDVYIDYLINLNGIKKEIKFPGCESELKGIDTLIDSAS